MKQYLLLLIISISFCSSAIADGLEPATIPTPNASALARYGEIPMSLFTGRANISIPIYETAHRDVPFSINLSYDTSGILINTLPSWTGHSWTLNAGGIITRNVKGYYDEYDKEQHYAQLHVPNLWENYFTRYADCVPFEIGFGDYMPDIFSFSFMGKTGKFFLGNDGEWKVASDDNLAVEFDIDDPDNYIRPIAERFPSVTGTGYPLPKTIKGFTIIDDKGNRYVFGGSKEDNAIECSIDLLDDNEANADAEWYADAWYLKDVYDRFGNKLYSFEYERGYFIISSAICYSNEMPKMRINSPVYLKTIQVRDGTQIDFVRDSTTILTSTDFYNNLYKSFDYDLTRMRTLIWNKMHGHDIVLPFYYLTSDAFSQYQNPNNTNKQQDPLRSMGLSPLSKIRISCRDQIYKQFSLNYDPTPNTRLHLSGICIDDGNGTIEGNYAFKYQGFENLPTVDGKPDYLTTGSDHWGYYNGVDHPDSLSKDTDPICCGYGMMSEIRYPTGGVTTINYTANHYEDARNVTRDGLDIKTDDDYYSSRWAGGLCVSRITNFEDSTRTKRLNDKSYNYYHGILSFTPVLSFYDAGELPPFQGFSITPGINSVGPHVGYSEVLENEEFDNGNDRINIYKFINYTDYCEESTSPEVGHNGRGWLDIYYDRCAAYDEWTSRDFMLGKLLSKTTTNCDDTEWERTTYTYRTDSISMEQNYVLARQEATKKVHPHLNLDYPANIPYKLFYPKYDVVAMKHEVRVGNFYNNIWYTDSTYYDKMDVSTLIHKGALSYMADYRRCMAEIVIRKNSTVVTNFTYSNITALQNEFYLQPTGTFIYHNGRLVRGTDVVFGLFRGRYLPQRVREYHNASMDFPVLQYNDYSDTFLPISLTNAFGQTITQTWNEFDQPLSCSVNNFLTTYSYNSRGLLSSITYPTDISTSYLYDSFNRLSATVDTSGNIIKKYSYKYKTAE